MSSAAPSPEQKAAQETYYVRTIADLTAADAEWAAMSIEQRYDLIYYAMRREDSPITSICDPEKEQARATAKHAAYLAAMKTEQFAGMTGWRPAALKAYVMDIIWRVSDDIAWSDAWDIAAGRDAAWHTARLDDLYKQLFRTVATFKEFWAGASYDERRHYIYHRSRCEQDARNY